ncbi:hypothetical protein FACS1894184_19940 [Clostridia bacterium]|nr:hypothetical protein FACS1894184_19940 [Clostridia bacterium]
MNEWRVYYTDQAYEDLVNIHKYIEGELLEPDIARAQTLRIHESVLTLNEMPYRFKLYDKEPYKSLGLRMMPVDNFLVFYMTDENKHAVPAIRILYGRQNIITQLARTDFDL